MTDAIEAGARAAARIISCSDGGRWRPGHGNNFPDEYDPSEQKTIREISKVIIEAAIASGALVPSSAVTEMHARCKKAAEQAVVYANGHPQIDAPTPGDMQRAIVKAIDDLE